MAEESDGVGEAFDDSLRVALTIAAQFAERIARLREQGARQRTAAASQEARELQARFDSERHAARAALTPVKQTGWWNTAGVEEIAAVYETARVWREHDDVAERAVDTIRTEVQDRYGIDVDDPRADPGLLAARLQEIEDTDRNRDTPLAESAGELEGYLEQARATLQSSAEVPSEVESAFDAHFRRAREDEARGVTPFQVEAGYAPETLLLILETTEQARLEAVHGYTPEQARQAAEAERDRVLAERRQRDGNDFALAEILFATADRHDRDTRAEHDPAAPAGSPVAGDLLAEYDSAERRQAFADSLEGVADPRTVSAVVLADGENAKHPKEAVMSQPGKLARRHQTPTAGSARERSKPGLTR